jgi:hypothetical protein
MKSPIEIIWVDAPAAHVSKFDSLIDALLENPGRWIMLPTPSKNSNSGLRMVIKRRNLPIKTTTRLRSDGAFDIYAVCTTGIAQTALLGVPEQKESDA